MRTSRLRPASTLLLLGFAAATVGCRPAEPEDNGVNAAEEPVLNIPNVPFPEPPMSRSEILSAVARAASAAAAGAEQSPEERPLDGRRFELRIRFGCRGPAPDLQEAALGWAISRDNGTLRVRATPTISMDDETVRQVAGEEFEAVEGFWIPRPWLLEAVCPAAAAVRAAPAEAPEEPGADVEDVQETEAPPPAHPRVGLAQFFTATDPRTRQRDMRPYQVVKTIERDQPIGSQGFNLVLSGRLRALPGRGVIHCVSRGSDAPPDCIVSASIDRVRIERPDNGEMLAEWRSS